MTPKAGRSRPLRKVLAVLVMAAAGYGAVKMLSLARRARPADARLRGQLPTVVHASGALSMRVPAFLGPVKQLSDEGLIGLRAGAPDGGAFLVVTLTGESAPPFTSEKAGFEPFLADSYLECLALGERQADGQTGKPGAAEKTPGYWWKVIEDADIDAADFKMKLIAARNTIPLVSRVCVAGTNELTTLNVRILMLLLAENYDTFAADIQKAFASIDVDMAKASSLLNVK